MSISKGDFLLAQKVVAARQTREAKHERKAQVLASMDPGAPPSEQAAKVAAMRQQREAAKARNESTKTAVYSQAVKELNCRGELYKPRRVERHANPRPPADPSAPPPADGPATSPSRGSSGELVFEPELRQFIAAPLPKQQLVASYQKRVASDPWAKLNQHQLSRGASENDDQERARRVHMSEQREYLAQQIARKTASATSERMEQERAAEDVVQNARYEIAREKTLAKRAHARRQEQRHEFEEQMATRARLKADAVVRARAQERKESARVVALVAREEAANRAKKEAMKARLADLKRENERVLEQRRVLAGVEAENDKQLMREYAAKLERDEVARSTAFASKQRKQDSIMGSVGASVHGEAARKEREHDERLLREALAGEAARRDDEAARKATARARLTEQQAAIAEQLARQKRERVLEFEKESAQAAAIVRADAEALAKEAQNQARARGRAVDNARLLTNQIHEVAQRKANERSLSVSQEELKYNKRLMVEAGVLV